jgi:hypothetical protein
LYINDLPQATADTALSILFADDTSLLTFYKSPDILETKLIASLIIVDKWFKSNLLSINFLKTYTMQFITKNSVSTKASISANNNDIMEVFHLKFLGLEVDNVLSWNIHIDSVISKLTTVCFMIRSVRPYMSASSMVKIYHSLFHFILSYGIIFWGQAANTKNLFMIQKNAVRLMTGHCNRQSCRNLFRQLGILPLKSQYTAVLLFLLKNRKLFTTNHEAHNLQTRQSNNLYLSTSTLTLYQKGVYFTGIKLFNDLPLEIKEIVGISKQFKISLRKYLCGLSVFTATTTYDS